MKSVCRKTDQRQSFLSTYYGLQDAYLILSSQASESSQRRFGFRSPPSRLTNGACRCSSWLWSSVKSSTSARTTFIRSVHLATMDKPSLRSKSRTREDVNGRTNFCKNVAELSHLIMFLAMLVQKGQAKMRKNSILFTLSLSHAFVLIWPPQIRHLNAASFKCSPTLKYSST